MSKEVGETHKTFEPGIKYLPFSGNTVSSDLEISSVAKIAVTDNQKALKPMWRPGQILRCQCRSGISLKDDTVSLNNTPSAKAKNNVARIFDVPVKSAIFNEALRLERFGVGIEFLITSHTPVITVRISVLTYLENTRDLTMN
jgi:hypothetical protein